MADWTEYEIQFLTEHYARMGRKWCADSLGRSIHQVRSKTFRLGLKQDKCSDFFKDWQKRAAESKVGKKRPEQSFVMKNNHKEGKLLKSPEQRATIGRRMTDYWKENDHPRGMAGKNHSDATKAIISGNSKAWWANASEEVREAYAARFCIQGQKSFKNREGASWKAAWREIGGKKKYYRSAWEANYARYLEWLKQRGEIKVWEHEAETFWFSGIKRGCMSYLPDFRVTELDGRISYHEVKGWMDDRSKTKIKRMATYFPHIKLVVIDAKAYRSLSQQLHRLIPTWE